MHTKDTILSGLRVEQNGWPIYAQIRDQVLAVLGRGDLVPGDQMPTMRQVAVALKVDLNTVRHAYDELEQRGAIVLVRGRGSFVAAPPPPPREDVVQEALEALAHQTLAAAKARGLDPGALVRHMARLLDPKD
jgi:GntR family transcriptional regulator